MSTSTYLKDEIMDHIFNQAAWSSGLTHDIYVSLHTADPGGTGSNECTDDNYARQKHNSWNAASSRSADNNGRITFPATAANQTITHFGLWDAVSDGYFLLYDSLASSKTITAGVAAYFEDEELIVTIPSGVITTYLTNKVLDHILKTAELAATIATYLGLHNGSPGDAGTEGTAQTSFSDDRLVVNKNSGSTPKWELSSSGLVTTAASSDLVWTASGDVTFNYVTIYDADSSGNMLFYHELNSPQTLADTGTFTISSGDADQTMA